MLNMVGEYKAKVIHSVGVLGYLAWHSALFKRHTGRTYHPRPAKQIWNPNLSSKNPHDLDCRPLRPDPPSSILEGSALSGVSFGVSWIG
jgi:hypothetical protein